LRNQGATVEQLLALIGATADDLDAAGDPVATRTAERLRRAVESTRRATAAVLGFASAPRDAAAVSVPYLMLLGVLAGGYMHALAVAAVARHDAPQDGDADRLAAADFYGAHQLPRVHALAETVAAGEIG